MIAGNVTSTPISMKRSEAGAGSVGRAFDHCFDSDLTSASKITALTTADNARMHSNDRSLSGGKEHLFSPLPPTISS